MQYYYMKMKSAVKDMILIVKLKFQELIVKSIWDNVNLIQIIHFSAIIHTLIFNFNHSLTVTDGHDMHDFQSLSNIHINTGMKCV